MVSYYFVDRAIDSAKSITSHSCIPAGYQIWRASRNE